MMMIQVLRTFVELARLRVFATVCIGIFEWSFGWKKGCAVGCKCHDRNSCQMCPARRNTSIMPRCELTSAANSRSWTQKKSPHKPSRLRSIPRSFDLVSFDWETMSIRHGTI